MIQFFSVVLSKSPVSDDGPVEVYGYIAVRDEIDGMLNYIVNYSRDDPVVVRQGSPIAMTGPKRGIEADYMVLIEFDMRIKNGARGEDDQQLIDGAISSYHRSAWKPIRHRIVGDCGGAVDMSFAAMDKALEATIEVVVTSEVQSGLSLSLSSFLLDALHDYEEIQLFHGVVHQSGPLRRFVVAVSFLTTMILEFKVGNGVERPVTVWNVLDR
nr:unnamed protein product [Digitaria exilis]